MPTKPLNLFKIYVRLRKKDELVYYSLDNILCRRSLVRQICLQQFLFAILELGFQTVFTVTCYRHTLVDNDNDDSLYYGIEVLQ